MDEFMFSRTFVIGYFGTLHLPKEGFHRSMITHRDRFLEIVRKPPNSKEAGNLAARFAVVAFQPKDRTASSEDIVSANGKPQNKKRRISATYDYRDEKGDLLFQVLRFEPKGFRQRRPKEGGGWNWCVKALSWLNLHFEMSAYIQRNYSKIVFLELVV